MRFESYDLDVKATAVTAADANCGEIFDVASFTDRLVVLTPGNAGNKLQLQAGLTRDKLIPVGAEADGATDDDLPVEIHGGWKYIQVATTAYAAGTPAAEFGGLNHRTV